VSGFVALTLTPMMCSKLLKTHVKHGKLFMTMERAFDAVTDGYRRVLTRSLTVRPLIVLGGVLVAGCSALFFMQLSAETAPTEDRGAIRLFGRAPEGATATYTARYSRQVEQAIAGTNDMRAFLINSGVPESTNLFGFIMLNDWEGRDRKQQDITREIQNKLGRIAGVSAFASNPGSLGESGGLGGKPVNFVIQSSGTYESLRETADALVARLQGSPILEDVESDLVLTKPELQ